MPEVCGLKVGAIIITTLTSLTTLTTTNTTPPRQTFYTNLSQLRAGPPCSLRTPIITTITIKTIMDLSQNSINIK